MASVSVLVKFDGDTMEARFGGMDVAEARRLKGLESENERFKRLITEQLVIDGQGCFDCPDATVKRAHKN